MKQINEEAVMAIHELTAAIRELSWCSVSESATDISERLRNSQIRILNAAEYLDRAKRIL